MTTVQASTTASTATPDPRAQRDAELHARVEPDATQTAAASTPPTWTFTNKVTEQEETVTCMSGCDLDHTRDSDRPLHPEDVYCRASGTDIGLPLYGPMCESKGPEEFRILSWQIGVQPYSTKIGERLPHVDIEAVDDHWIEALDPDALATVIGQLQKQVDSLRAAHTQLVTTRATYIAREAEIEGWVDRTLDALREAEPETSA